MTTYKIVMVRHGESEWNQKNLFCGWFDANLSEKGTFFFANDADDLRITFDEGPFLNEIFLYFTKFYIFNSIRNAIL